MISSQRPWPLDHEAGRELSNLKLRICRLHRELIYGAEGEMQSDFDLRVT